MSVGFLERTEYKTHDERRQRKLAWQREYRKKNIDKVRAQGRKYAKERREHKAEEIKEVKLKDYQKNREYYLEKSRLWRIQNKERYNAKCRELYRKRVSFAKKARCIGCTILLKEDEPLVCKWCLLNYPHKYSNIHI